MLDILPAVTQLQNVSGFPECFGTLIGVSGDDDAPVGFHTRPPLSHPGILSANNAGVDQIPGLKAQPLFLLRRDA
ncbi:MAG TPA: hypothetical protein DD856_10805 [Sulfobacillus sp.]|nr:hypothetical protein [Sulfobacillus sp.]